MHDAFMMLKEDHDRIALLFKQSRASGGTKVNHQIFDQIRSVLDNHTHIEETILYPTCEKHQELKRMALEFNDAHAEVKELMFQITRSARDDANIAPKLRSLMERVEAHIQEEEERLFPLAEKVMRRNELEYMRAEIESARRRLGIWTHGAGPGAMQPYPEED